MIKEIKNYNCDFIKTLIQKTYDNTIYWDVIPYQAYIHDRERSKISLMETCDERRNWYYQVIENMSFPYDNKMTVYTSKINDAYLYLVERKDYDYSLVKYEYTLRIISQKSLSNDINTNSTSTGFNYAIHFDDIDIDTEFMLLQKLAKIIEDNNTVINGKYAKEYIEKYVKMNK